MRSRWSKFWRRVVSRLRAARLLRATVTQTFVPDPIEVDPTPVYPDLSDLDPVELADWKRFMQMMESGENQALVEEPNMTRFLAIKDKVKWVPAPLSHGSDPAAV